MSKNKNKSQSGNPAGPVLPSSGLPGKPQAGPLPGRSVVWAGRRLSVSLPVGELEPRGYESKWVTTFELTRPQAQELRRLKRGLAKHGVVKENGRAVESSAQVFQWLLEELARCRVALDDKSAPVEEVTPGLPGTEQIAKPA